MNHCCHDVRKRCVIAVVLTSVAAGEPLTPSTQTGRKGATLYVSKLGDNSDGSSWPKAFRTIQAALQAVPDDKGGHRIVIRPDHYMEALLFPAHKGAPGAYNVLEADWDGRMGSGATGYAVIDSGDPEKGHKSVDWWGTAKCDPQFSCLGWDRWVYRHLYTCGAEGAGWDLTCERGAPFTAIAEDCFFVGRFSGVCIGAFCGRRDEPVTIRRCHSWALDWWGDAAGAYVRAENPRMPDSPDVVFEDCTLVGPDNALQAGNPGFAGYTRVKLKNCRLVSLNFSQPHGQPSTGVIFSTIKGEYLHVDLEDCFLMGYKVFGAGGMQFGMGQPNPPGGDISYTTKGTCKAYVQFQQNVPKGFVRVGSWPVEVFNQLLPAAFWCESVRAAGSVCPQPGLTAMGTSRLGVGTAALIKLPCHVDADFCEMSPVIYKGRPLLVFNRRPGGPKPKAADMALYVKDQHSGKEVAKFGVGHSFVSAFVNGDELNVFASEYTDDDWTHDIYRFSTTDLKTWKRELVIPRDGGEHLFNTSVCRDDQGYLMAYESNRPAQWCFKFARSKDLSRWEKIPGLVFAGKGNEFSACPVIRYVAPYYYVIYVREAIGKPGWVPFITRSTDLATWELSPKNPIFEPSEGEGINNSDVDLFEYQGRTYVYYLTGDQQTWGTTKCAVYPGPMAEFLQGYFPANTPTVRVTARR